MLAVAGLLVVLLAAASARLFVWPPVDAPARADAVVALGGDPGQRRAALAVQLARQGFAPVAVISLGGTTPAPCPRPVRGVRIVCFRARPLDTRGEAEHVAALVARHRWRTIIVVPERSQSTRARMLFERCTPARLLVVPVDDPVSHLPYDVRLRMGGPGQGAGTPPRVLTCPTWSGPGRDVPVQPKGPGGKRRRGPGGHIGAARAPSGAPRFPDIGLSLSGRPNAPEDHQN